MGAVRVMQVAVNEVIDVVAVRHRFVAATGTVDVLLGVPSASVSRRAGAGILARHVDRMLYDLVAFVVMQVAVVQVIDMIAMLDARVSAVLAMLVVVVVMMSHVSLLHRA
jgi:hypothetical protein